MNKAGDYYMVHGRKFDTGTNTTVYKVFNDAAEVAAKCIDAEDSVRPWHYYVRPWASSGWVVAVVDEDGHELGTI